MEKINVLWTGGLDSTYLVFKLCKLGGMEIQPYYILDEERKSVNKELTAISKITNRILRSPDFSSKLNDIIIIRKAEIMQDSEITSSWKELHKECVLGSQYDFLARFAKQMGDIKLMVGVLWHDNGRAQKSILGKVELIEENIGTFSVYSVKKNPNGDINSYRLYENILFPVCMRHIEKVDEWEELTSEGYEDIANMTWFCHRPIMGMPCGHCNPCKDALHEGMAFRVPRVGRFLGGIAVSIQRCKGAIKRLLH